jgi:hypothetical protein
VRGYLYSFPDFQPTLMSFDCGNFLARGLFAAKYESEKTWRDWGVFWQYNRIFLRSNTDFILGRYLHETKSFSGTLSPPLSAHDHFRFLKGKHTDKGLLLRISIHPSPTLNRVVYIYLTNLTIVLCCFSQDPFSICWPCWHSSTGSSTTRSESGTFWLRALEKNGSSIRRKGGSYSETELERAPILIRFCLQLWG